MEGLKKCIFCCNPCSVVGGLIDNKDKSLVMKGLAD
jgi:hypothetical protein